MTYEELERIIKAKPVDGSPEELRAWRAKVKEARREYDREYWQALAEREAQWEPGEWEELEKKLRMLSLEQLKTLTDRVGINFTIGNDKITDKEEFILVLDEADKDELYKEYERLIAD